ncbi:MAG: RDD family protein, partial [Balneolales bacterium]|nr:RDD family protein [Balneolales bacterium]
GVYQTLKKMFGMLGLSLGWVGIYFVASIAFFRGQTLGKRLLKIRVIRLNNKPISIFFSFERFGGYAAGIATGLLGFFQIFWDVNRQGIHDKIAGTVVIDLREKRAASTAHLREEILDQENLLS